MALWQRWLPEDCGTLCGWGPSMLIHYSVKESLRPFFNRSEANFHLHFWGLGQFRERYCAEEQTCGNPFHDEATFGTAMEDWVRILKLNSGESMVPLLCCPEYVQYCDECALTKQTLCDPCSVPLCFSCVG